MVSKTLVLHIGMPKTGTTSIQEAFGRNNKKLRKEGIFYPAKKPYNHANTFAPIFLENRLNTIYFKQHKINTEEKAQKKVIELKRYWNKQFESNAVDTFIISAESLYRLSTNEIAELKAFVAPFFDDFKVIVYIRKPEVALKSLWGQYVKTLSEQHSPKALFDSVVKTYNYHFVERWAEAFGTDKVIVRPFEQSAMVNGSLLDDFSISIGAEAGLFPKDMVANESFGRHALALLYESNLQYPLFVNRATNPEKGLSDKMGVFFRLLQRVDDEKYDLKIHFNSAQAKKINESIDIINQYLDDEMRFDHVGICDEPMNFPNFDDIPKAFVISLINEYNKYIDELLEVNLHAQAELVNPQAGKYLRTISRFLRKCLAKAGFLPH